MKVISRIAFALLFTLLGAGCVSNTSAIHSVKMVSEFMKTAKDRKIGIAVTDRWAKPQYRVKGVIGGGILDQILLAAVSYDIKNHLNNIDTSNFFKIADFLEKKLTKRGFNVKKLDTVLHGREFACDPNCGIKNGKRTPEFDYRPLINQESIDTLILLGVEYAGITQKYFWFIPIGDPQAFSFVFGQVIDLKTNTILWARESKGKNMIAKVKSPAYLEVTTAVNAAVDSAAEKLRVDFLKDIRKYEDEKIEKDDYSEEKDTKQPSSSATAVTEVSVSSNSAANNANVVSAK